MALVNENFAKTRSGVEAVEVAAATAQRKADAAIADIEKGAAGGVAPLDATGKVPAAHLPPPAIPMTQKSAPGAWHRWMMTAVCLPIICRCRSRRYPWRKRANPMVLRRWLLTARYLSDNCLSLFQPRRGHSLMA